MTTRNGMLSGTEGTTSTMENLKETVRGIVDQGQDQMNAIKDRVIDAKRHAVDRGGAYLERFTDLIRANPLKSVGLAFGIGYVAMRLFRR